MSRIVAKESTADVHSLAMSRDIASGVRVRTYEVIRRAVEEGSQRGISRAFKHTDAPSRELIAQAVEDAIMGELCDVLAFEEPA